MKAKDLSYYFSKIRELPPEVAMKKAVMKLARVLGCKIEKLKTRFSPTHISDEELLQSLEGFTSLADALRAIRKERPLFFVRISAKEELVSLIRRQLPHLEAEIVEEAETVCRHVFDLLGSGPVNLDEFTKKHGGREACGYLPWHFDFKTGYRWNPKKFYKEIEIPYGKADIKIPWELSRFQHAAVLGQAYWLTGDEKYTEEFVRQVEDWIDRNPHKFGVNWACTMDVAIRVANWILGFYFFKDSKTLTDDFLVKFLKSLLIHGRHIMANLENKGITNNHYLADLVGLIYLGIAFPEFAEARRWRELGVKELVLEMDKQVYDDGMDFEASTCYHRLALELFFYPTLLCQLNGIDLPQAFLDKLEKMFDFVLYVLKPNGRMPQIGDNDNGRLHVLRKRDVLDMTYLLAFATIWFDDSRYNIEEFGFAPEALWVFGPKACRRWRELPARSVEELESRAFRDGGIYVMRHKKDYMVISCGPNGQGGIGGHAHNDKLSFELCVGGEDIIVDPGTYVYTADPEWRNAFRSTAYHNTTAPINTQQNQLPLDSFHLFSLPQTFETKTNKWKISTSMYLYTGEHIGFYSARLPLLLTHQRMIVYHKQKQTWMIEDKIANHETQPIWVQGVLVIASGVQLTHEDKNVFILASNNNRVFIVFETVDVSCEIASIWYSRHYGLKEAIYQITFTSLVPAQEDICVRYTVGVEK